MKRDLPHSCTHQSAGSPLSTKNRFQIHSAGRGQSDLLRWLLYFAWAQLRRTTDVLVRRSSKLSTRTDADVRPTKCLSPPRAEYKSDNDQW